MQRRNLQLATSLLTFLTINGSATVLYVDVNSANPTAPYTNWATAAMTIQDAVDAGVAGDQILVTNGVYQTGGRAAYGTMTNRVAVDKALTVRSVNGSELTAIHGYQLPDTITGDGAIRCVYLTNGASLTGFKLAKGATRRTGNEYHERSGGGVWCEPSAVVSNCVIIGNSAEFYGGGVYSGTLYNCALSGNLAASGGGASGDLTEGLRVKLNNCTLIGNSAGGRGGVLQGRLNNCILYFNNPDNYVVTDIINYSCTTPLPPGGAGNLDTDPQMADPLHLSADSPCRGAGSAAYASGTDIDGQPWATPPSIGCDEYSTGAITGTLSVNLVTTRTNATPGFAIGLIANIEGISTRSVWEFGDGLVASNGPYSGRLVASHSWATPGDYAVILRAYNNSYPDGVSATQVVHIITPPIHYVAPDSTTPTPPYTSWATAAHTIQDAIDAYDAATVPGAWVLVTNGIFAEGGRAVYGTMTNRIVVDKPLTVLSVNGPAVTIITGYQVPGTTNGDGAIRCVYLANGASLSGFTITNGATRTVSDRDGGGLWCESTEVMVSNCIVTANSAYRTGGGVYRGSLYSCTLSNNSVKEYLNSFGGGAYSSILVNCILAGNSSVHDCGGAMNSTLTNCKLIGNSSTENGGGADLSTLNNCTLIGNSAYFGGGAIYGTLNNCTVLANSASEGGGVFGATLRNCIVYYNAAPSVSNYSGGTMNYCCTAPFPGGTGNITNAPLFVNRTGGDLRLQSNSPCINSGYNAYAPPVTDLDGNSRIVGGTVDMGAYEFQSPSSVLSYAWAQQYGFPTDGSADYSDSDSDLMNNWQEWIAGTIPTNALSVLRLLNPTNDVAGVNVTWQSVNNRTYFLERATNLGALPPFSLLKSNIIGQATTTSYIDTNAVGDGPFFYRVGVQQ